jgi:HSP20 family protein
MKERRTMAAPVQEKTAVSTPAAPAAKAEQRPARMRDVFDMFDQFQREMGRMWGDMSPLFPRPISRALGRPSDAATTWAPRMDVYEKDGHLVVKAELPGVKNEDIKVTLRDRGLIVEGERKTEHEVKEEDYYRSERAYGRFYRYLPLDFEVDANKVKATCKDGVLEVRIPRPAQPEASGKSIPISS